VAVNFGKMKGCLALQFLLLLLFHGAQGASMRGRLLHRQEKGSGVVTLLNEAQKIVEQGGDVDQKVTDKVGCWCQKNLEAARSYVDGLQQQLSSLGSDLEAQTAEKAQIDAQLEQSTAELADSQKSLNVVTALHVKTSAKMADDHQQTQQTVNQLDSALEAIKSSHGHGLSMVERMKRMMDGAETDGRASSLLQMKQRLKGANSPQEVYGVLKEMRFQFARDLDEMKSDAQVQKTRHEDLTDAKAKEIASIKKQVMAKKQRTAVLGLTLSRQQEVKEKSERVVEVSNAIAASMQGFCEKATQSSETRRGERQALIVALADARAQLSGAQLLMLHSGNPLGVEPVKPEDFCLLAAGMSEDQWREQAETACSEAKAGKLQNAAETAEALEDDIKAALDAANSEADKCREQQEESAAESARAAKNNEVRANSVNVDKEGADTKISELTERAAACDKASAELTELQSQQQELLQRLRIDSNKVESLLRKVGGEVSAPTRLGEAADHCKKLAEASEAHGRSVDEAVPQITGALTEFSRASSSALVPLRLLRADAEEDAVSAHEEQERITRKASKGPSCDQLGISSKIRQLTGYTKKLSDATVSLAWGSLR